MRSVSNQLRLNEVEAAIEDLEDGDLPSSLFPGVTLPELRAMRKELLS